MTNETIKNLQANTVGKPLPKNFATVGTHSALAAAMIVPVSIAIRLVIVISSNRMGIQSIIFVCVTVVVGYYFHLVMFTFGLTNIQYQ